MSRLVVWCVVCALLAGCNMSIEPKYYKPVAPTVSITALPTGLHPAPTQDTCRVVNAEVALNIRAAPDGAKLAQLSARQRVQVVGVARDGWQEVEAGGWRGFVWAGYLAACQ